MSLLKLSKVTPYIFFVDIPHPFPVGNNLFVKHIILLSHKAIIIFAGPKTISEEVIWLQEKIIALNYKLGSLLKEKYQFQSDFDELFTKKGILEEQLARALQIYNASK